MIHGICHDAAWRRMCERIKTVPRYKYNFEHTVCVVWTNMLSFTLVADGTNKTAISLAFHIADTLLVVDALPPSQSMELIPSRICHQLLTPTVWWHIRHWRIWLTLLYTTLENIAHSQNYVGIVIDVHMWVLFRAVVSDHRPMYLS